MKHRYALHQNNQQQQPITAKKHAVNELLATPNIFRANKRARILSVCAACTKCMGHIFHIRLFFQFVSFRTCHSLLLRLPSIISRLEIVRCWNLALIKFLDTCAAVYRNADARFQFSLISASCFFFIIICSSAAVVDGNGTKTKDRAFGGALFAWNGWARSQGVQALCAIER